MGSGASTEREKVIPPPDEGSVDKDSKINVEVLFSALYKLMCVFEIKESLTMSLSNKILDPTHANFDCQFHGVEEWVKKHGDCELTPQEIYHLIKYVELYKPAPSNDKKFCDAENHPNTLESWDSLSDMNVVLPLICPFRKDVAEWTASIRKEETYKATFKDNDTLRFESFDYSCPATRTARVRFNSDVSEESDNI